MKKYFNKALVLVSIVLIVFASVLITIKRGATGERRSVMDGSVDKGIIENAVAGIDKEKPKHTETATFSLG